MKEGFTTKHKHSSILGSLFSLPSSDIIANTDKEYRKYYIAKADGGKREICEPSPRLKQIQKSLLPIIKNLPISKSCSAYEKGCSIKKNATRHINANHILHMDIKDFFPSITSKMFKEVFIDKIPVKDIDNVWRVVSYNGGLPIGACTSPFIANRIMYMIDKKLKRLSLLLKYTRYADDMIFSSKRIIDKEIIVKVSRILNSYGFTVNTEKTYFMSSRKEITGLIITSDKKLSVGTAFKKKLKSDIYNYLIKGEGNKEIIRGKISHLREIEPLYADTIMNKYKAIDNIGLLD